MIKGTKNFCALVAKLCGKDCSQFVIDQQSTLINFDQVAFPPPWSPPKECSNFPSSPCTIRKGDDGGGYYDDHDDGAGDHDDHDDCGQSC